MPRFSDPERLAPDHVLSGFDCLEPSLNLWLERHARDAARSGSAKTYVVNDTENNRVVGYHSLAVASIDREEETKRAGKGMPKHQLPAVLLARLAVDKEAQGKGIRASLLRDATQRALAVSEEAGVRLLLVHALNKKAAEFYSHFGFEASPIDPMNLQLLMKDIRASLDAAAGPG